MKRLTIACLACCCAGWALAQKPFKCSLYDSENNIFLHLDLYEESINVPMAVITTFFIHALLIRPLLPRRQPDIRGIITYIARLVNIFIVSPFENGRF